LAVLKQTLDLRRAKGIEQPEEVRAQQRGSTALGIRAGRRMGGHEEKPLARCSGRMVVVNNGIVEIILT